MNVVEANVKQGHVETAEEHETGGVDAGMAAVKIVDREDVEQSVHAESMGLQDAVKVRTSMVPRSSVVTSSSSLSYRALMLCRTNTPAHKSLAPSSHIVI